MFKIIKLLLPEESVFVLLFKLIKFTLWRWKDISPTSTTISLGSPLVQNLQLAKKKKKKKNKEEKDRQRNKI